MGGGRKHLPRRSPPLPRKRCLLPLCVRSHPPCDTPRRLAAWPVRYVALRSTRTGTKGDIGPGIRVPYRGLVLIY